MDYHSIDWASYFTTAATSADKEIAGSIASKQMWDKKAASFAHKSQRSDYIHQLIELMECRAGETVLDVGCGSGTLALPLVQRGCHVVAVDFSPGMLGELRAAAEAAGIATQELTSAAGALDAAAYTPGAITVVERSWQQAWDDLPVADTAVSSRSLITNDLADAVDKLEAHARQRVIVTTGAGDLPYRDHRVFAAMGRTEDARMEPVQLVSLANFLFARGRLPRIDYITFERVRRYDSCEELIESIRSTHAPRNDAESAALDAFFAEHVVRSTDGEQFELDYPRVDRWAYLEWSVTER